MNALLTVEDLWVRFPTRSGWFSAVRGSSFSVGHERLGIVGESGSGKSLTGRALLRLIKAPGQLNAKRLEYNGSDLLSLSEAHMRQIRGRHLAMIMQDPQYSLNPVMRVGLQISESYRLHRSASSKSGAAKALEMLEAVRIHDPGTSFCHVSPAIIRWDGSKGHDCHDANRPAELADCR